MAAPGNWFTSMFSDEATETDVVKATTLNITKITALLVPMATGILAAVEAFVEKGPLENLTPGQHVVIVIALIAFVALVVVTDMLVRGIVTASSLNAPVSPLPAISAAWTRPQKDLGCTVVGARSGSIEEQTGASLLIVLTEEADQWKKGAVLWVPAGDVSFK
jgi:hypothetical protein